MAGIVYATVLDTYFLNNINVRYFVIQGTCIMHIFVSYKMCNTFAVIKKHFNDSFTSYSNYNKWINYIF